MRKRIQRSMVLIITVTLLISYGIATLVVYRQTLRLIKSEIIQEADYISAALRISGDGFLKDMDAVRKNTRVTLIEPTGKVLYDSREEDMPLESHRDRPEVEKALRDGSGWEIRRSDTLGREMFYYALAMPDGRILRVSKTVDTAFYTAVRIFPVMGLIAAAMILFAWFLSKWQVEKLIRPVNGIDLDHPLENNVYEELTPLLQRIERQNREKDDAAGLRKEFSANVSHELKTPLTSISGYAEIMMDGLVKPEDMAAFSGRIYHEASRLISLVEDIIKLSRLDEGEVALEKEEVDLFSLAEEVCSRLTPQAQAHGVRIEAAGEPVPYLGIRRILDEMIYNLCENAVKYNRPGGAVTVWAGNTLSGRKIIVTDTGIGIPKDQQERVFERFYRVDKSHSRETGGTGLGLSIVKHGALLHGAQISLESEPGRGTRIELLFQKK